MVRVNWDDVPEAKGILPSGEYACAVIDVEEKTTANGDQLWRLQLQVIRGEHLGKTVYDNLVFSERALPRAKLILKSLGMGLAGVIDMVPGMLHGRTALVEVLVEDYEANDGTMKKRAIVPYAGYHVLNGPQHDQKKQAPRRSQATSHSQNRQPQTTRQSYPQQPAQPQQPRAPQAWGSKPWNGNGNEESNYNQNQNNEVLDQNNEVLEDDLSPTEKVLKAAGGPLDKLPF